MYQQLAEAIGAGDSTIMPKIFKLLANEKEAGFLLAASPPATIAEIVEKTGLQPNEVEQMVDPLFKKGLIFKTVKEGITRYYRVRHLLQFHDAAILAQGMPPEYFDLWRQYNKTEFKQHHKAIESILDKSAVRVVPVNITIDPGARVAPFDDVKEVVKNARNLAVTKCTCRLIEGDCGKPVEVCIQLDKAADYAVERGTGRQLGKDEALEMLKMCEEEGLVHTVMNTKGLGHVICNCCDDCCINWPGPRSSGVNFASPSRFTAIVDAETCSGCETCLDRCYFDAISVDDDIAVIVEENCMGCGLCAVTCPEESITLKEIRSEDFIPG